MKDLEQQVYQSVTTLPSSSIKNDNTLKGSKGPEKSDEKRDEEHEATRSGDDSVKSNEKDSVTTGEKKDEGPDEAATPISTGLPTLPLHYAFDEDQSSDDEENSEENNSNTTQDSLSCHTNEDHLVQEKRRATKRDSIRRRHEMRIQELEQEVECLSGQNRRLQ
jgi:hypothetical protein